MVIESSSASFKLVKVSDVDQSFIDNFVVSHPDSMFYHSRKFISLLKDYLSCIDYSVVLVDENGIRGYLPLLGSLSSIGIVLNSLPYYGSHGSYLGKSSDLDIVQNWLRNICDQKNEIISCVVIDNPLTDIKLEGFGNVVDYRIGQMTKLWDQSEDDLIMRFHVKTRNSVRKGLLNLFEYDTGHNYISDLYRIHVENMSAINGKAKEWTFFEKIGSYFEHGKDYEVLVAKDGGVVISALLLFYWKDQIEYFTPCVSENYRSSQVLSSLIFKAMTQRMKTFRVWNWGGTWESQEGVYRFKSRFDAIDTKYNYRLICKEALLAHTPSKVSQLFKGFYVAPYSILKKEN
jgi:hypothetical protein